jgi:hypothetical protein
MNVHLIRTLDYSLDDLMEVHELLTHSGGPLNFIVHNEPLDVSEIFSQDQSIKEIPAELLPLTFDQLFRICHHFRRHLSPGEKIQKHAEYLNDFVILLTNHPNKANWFSAFDGRNIFVHTYGWEKFIAESHHVAVAFQVVENILQSLMSHGQLHPLFPLAHPYSIGCLNDFCQDKRDIILKMRTADLCPDCLKNFQEACPGMEDVLEQAFSLLEFFRGFLLFRNGFRRHLKPKPLKVDKKGNILIGEKQLNLGYLEAPLYLFFLLHKEGVAICDLYKYREEWLKLYKFFNPKREPAPLLEMLDEAQMGGRFHTTKSRLNKKIRDLVGSSLAEYYVISGERGKPFGISLPREYIKIELKLNLESQESEHDSPFRYFITRIWKRNTL